MSRTGQLLFDLFKAIVMCTPFGYISSANFSFNYECKIALACFLPSFVNYRHNIRICILNFHSSRFRMRLDSADFYCGPDFVRPYRNWTKWAPIYTGLPCFGMTISLDSTQTFSSSLTSITSVLSSRFIPGRTDLILMGRATTAENNQIFSSAKTHFSFSEVMF